MGKLLVGIVIVLGVLGIYFWSGSSKPATAPASKEAVTQPSATAPTTTSAAQEITVTGNEFAFQPSTLTLKKGEVVKITFKNTGKFPHNFALADLNVTTQTVAPGEQSAVLFTPDKTGTFAYTCTIGSHADKGMKGTLTVQ